MSIFRSWQRAVQRNHPSAYTAPQGQSSYATGTQIPDQVASGRHRLCHCGVLGGGVLMLPCSRQIRILVTALCLSLESLRAVPSGLEVISQGVTRSAYALGYVPPCGPLEIIWELCHVGYVWICMDMYEYVDMSWISVMDTWIHGYPVSLPGSTYQKKTVYLSKPSYP